MRRKSVCWTRAKINATDRLHSLVVRERDDHQCQWPGCGRSKAGGWQLHAAHIFSRRYKQTRHLTINALTLCATHHQWATDHDTEWQAFARQRIGEEAYTRLLILAKGPAMRAPDEFAARRGLHEELARLTREQVTG